ncbi:hypothetical protein BST61_g4732 [Cercospora zeina]
MAYFRITLLRSAIGLPKKISGVLHALGLKKRMTTVYHPVSQSVAGQIFAVKELVDVAEVEKPLTSSEMKEIRRPDPGFWQEEDGMYAAVQGTGLQAVRGGNALDKLRSGIDEHARRWIRMEVPIKAGRQL